MTEQEYHKEKLELKKQFELKEFELKIKYAIQFKTNNVGDVVTNGKVSIVVDSIKVTMKYYSNLPELIYYGVELTKKGFPNKRGERNTIYQSEIQTK